MFSQPKAYMYLCIHLFSLFVHLNLKAVVLPREDRILLSLYLSLSWLNTFKHIMRSVTQQTLNTKFCVVKISMCMHASAAIY